MIQIGHHLKILHVLMLAAASFGCVSLLTQSVSPKLPTDHGLEISPFLIRTDSPIAADDPAVQELISLREQVRSTLQHSPPSGQIEIYIFNDRTSFDRFMKSEYPELPRRRAFFIAQGSRQIVYTCCGERLCEDLRHEAAHALIHATFGELPLWLDEGLAEYFEMPTHGLHVRHLHELQLARETGWRRSV